MKVNKIPYFLIAMLFVIFLSGITSASLGRFNQDDCVPIVTNLNATTVNLSILTSPSPNPHIILTNVVMSKSGDSFNYTFCNTTIRGIYTYGYCDNNGNCYSNSFEVGDPGITVLLIIGLVMMIVFIFGWFQHNVWFVYLSGILGMVLGVYILINGFASINDVYTQAIGYSAIGFSIVFFVIGAYEQISSGSSGVSDED